MGKVDERLHKTDVPYVMPEDGRARAVVPISNFDLAGQHQLLLLSRYILLNEVTKKTIQSGVAGYEERLHHTDAVAYSYDSNKAASVQDIFQVFLFQKVERANFWWPWAKL